MTSNGHGSNGGQEPTFTLYSIDNCSFCRRAMALLEARGLSNREVNLAGDDVAREDLVRRTGMMTFPQVFMFDELVGGYEDLVALLAAPAPSPVEQ